MNATVLPKDSVNFVVISGINFPFGSRKYLMNLVKDLCLRERARFVIIAGNTLAGRELDQQLKVYQRLQAEYVKKENAQLARDAKKGERPSKQPFGPAEKERVQKDYIDFIAAKLNEFLPVIKDVNYHIVIAEKVFEKALGVMVLERLKEMREDIRLIRDPEAKVPVRMRGVDDIRVLVPSKEPWFYKMITGLMQRLVNSFISRTNSPRPSLVIVGGTGTGAYLPFYDGVPSISAPVLRKLDVQTSVENMVGAVLVNLTTDGNVLKIKPTTYDFRTLIFNERDFLIKDNPSPTERAVLEVLKRGSAGRQIVGFRVNENIPSRKHFSEKKINDALAALTSRRLILFDKEANRYEINEDILGFAKVTLDDFLKGGRLVRHVVEACRHTGALKSLYHTAEHDLPGFLVDADAFIDAGDSIQGISHNYEYNGELVPIANGFDKQQVLSAGMIGTNLIDAFRLRAERLGKKPKVGFEEFVRKCLVPFVFTTGNHPGWTFWTKNSLVLHLFEELLQKNLIAGIWGICRDYGYSDIDFGLIVKIVRENVIRVGEDNIVEVGGVRFGVKHPHKARSVTKSARVQDVVDYVYGAFYAYMRRTGETRPDVPIVYVGNFHEAAAVHVSKFGRTLLGVMIGAYLKDTQFENDKDKVVDIGPAKVEFYLGPSGQILYSNVEFVNNIHPEDRKLVLASHISTKLVVDLCSYLANKYELPWR